MDYLNDAVNFLRRLDKPCVVYGHSLGAMVALATANAEQDKVKALVLEDPPFSTMGEQIRSFLGLRYFQGVEHCLCVDRPPNLESMYRAFSNIVVGTTHDGQSILVKDQRDETSRRFSAECLMCVDPKVMEPITLGRWLEGYDLNQILHKIRCPVTLFQADSRLGGMLTDPDAGLITSTIGDLCQLQYFPNTGHSIHWTNPQDTIAAIRHQIEG